MMVGVEKEILILVSKIRCITESQVGKFFGTRKRYTRNAPIKTGREKRILEGKLFCKECGNRLSVYYRKKLDYWSINCNRYSRDPKRGRCSSHFYPYDYLEEQILEKIDESVSSFIKKLDIEELNNEVVKTIHKETQSVDKKISDLVNNDYLTREEKIDGYTLVDIIGEVEGKIGIDTKYVKYIYYKNNSEVLPDLIKTGTSRIDNLDNKIDYNIKYKSKINDYIGTLEVTIIDYLPYKIDIDNSLLGDFTYNPRDNTLTYKYTKEVNTYLNGEFDIDISLDITLKYLDINLSSRIIKNKVTSYIITDKKKELTDECITNIDIKSNVLVEYVDTLGNKIDNDIIITNFVGNDYITNAKDIKGYTFKEVLGEVVGKHQFSDIKVTYIYEKNKLVPPKTGNSEINYIALTIIAINLIMGIILKLRRVNI